MAENRIFVSAKFFKYIGPGETDGNSRYTCLNCSVALKTRMALLWTMDVAIVLEIILGST